jgi:3-hydroxyacyl-CoA dehydrogenase
LDLNKDEFGIDDIASIAYYLQKIFNERLADPSVMELFQIFVKNNFLGRKSGQGFYIYQNNGKKAINPNIKELLKNSLTQTKQM